MKFQIGDFVVCPGHGVGQVEEIESKSLGPGNIENEFYIIKIITNGMKVMVPVSSEESIRALADGNEISEVFKLLSNHDVKVDNSTWNRRYRDYMEKIKTGDLKEIAEVVRALFLLKDTKSLSFGEKKMLDFCKELLIKEIAISDGLDEIDVSNKIEGCFS